MTRSLRRLKEQIVRANLLAQEAGFFAEELNKKTEYLVTLQIPAANLDANRKVGVSTNARKRNGFTPFEQTHVQAVGRFVPRKGQIQRSDEEVDKRIDFFFFLSLPFPSQRDVVLSEPAIQVRRKGKGKQIWALEKMENRLVDMRELYQEWKEFDEDNPVSEYSGMQSCSCQSASSVSSFGDILLWVTCIISLP